MSPLIVITKVFGPDLVDDLEFDNDQLVKINFKATGKYCVCQDADVIFKIRDPWCEYVAQVITPFGQNKAWWSRVAAESGQQYIVPNLNYNFLYDYKPFGSLVPPDPADNPQAWDADEKENNIQALPVTKPDKVNFTDPYQARAGKC